MTDNFLNKSKDILKKIEDIVKCEKCHMKYDYNFHRPMVIKCGHTFCKHCLINSNERNSKNSNVIDYKQKKIFICPIDGIQHIFNLENNLNKIDPSIYPNLKIEIILKELLNINEPAIKEKYIIYTKPDMKRSRSPDNNAKNNYNNNSEGNYADNKDNSGNNKNRSDSNNINKNKNINIKINSGNQIINVNAINVNMVTREILKKDEKNKNIDINNNKSAQKGNNTDNINNNNNNNDNDYINNNNDSLNDDLNNIQINEEINVNEGKLNFESEKLNDDSIETIPLNEEKSMTNMSFRDDFKELLNKNYDFKSQFSGNLKTDDNDINNNNNNNIKRRVINNDLKQTMKTYNKKNLVYETNRSNNKYSNNLKLTEPSKETN